MNGFLLSVVLLLLYSSQRPPAAYFLERSISSASSPSPNSQNMATTMLGTRHQLTYQQWVDLLEKEAKFAAAHQPKNLTILAGDSLSLWFPSELLPKERNWLNQGISGETSAGLLNRLELLDSTRPQVIFVMIGINDLIRQIPEATLLANHREIVRYLRRRHPNSTIVVQSILPHASQNATWEGKERLLGIPNSRIQSLNRELNAIAQAEEVQFLDLYPLFADAQGNLRPELTSDGLHLSPQGYWVWRYALQVFLQLQMDQNSSSQRP